MKKLIALILALVMTAFTFAACAKDNPTDGQQGENQPAGNEQTDDKQDDKEKDDGKIELPAQEFVYDRVVILGVDGCGAFFTETDTPNVDRIFANGAITYTMQAVMPSSSAPNWGAMLHGVEPEFHNLTNDVAENFEFPSNSAFPSIFRIVREAYPDAELASFSTWEPINYGIVEPNLGVHKETADNDGLLTDKILAYLNDNDPKLLFVQFDECDSAGHGSGYGNPEHLETLTKIDGYIGQIYDFYQENGRGEKTLFIVSGDHGGTPGGNHGGDTDKELNIMFAAAGESVIDGGVPMSFDVKGNESDMSVRDIAAVAARAFGLEIPETWTGMVPNNLFTDCSYTASRKLYKVEYQYEHRTHYSEATPKEGSGNYITEVFEDRVLVYLPFDSSFADVMGTETIEFNKVNYISGYYGKAANFKNGSMRVEEFWPGNDSFTVSFWFQSAENTSDPIFVANKNCLVEEGRGFALAFQPGCILFNFGDGTNVMNATYPLPVDHHKGWVHVILSVDRKANTVGLSYDFGEFTVIEIPEELSGADMDGMGSLYIGQDASMSRSELKPPVDEVIVFDGAFTAADVAALAEYYGINK